MTSSWFFLSTLSISLCDYASLYGTNNILSKLYSWNTCCHSQKTENHLLGGYDKNKVIIHTQRKGFGRIEIVHKNNPYVSTGTEHVVHQSNGTTHIEVSPFYLLAAIFPLYDAICSITLSVTMSRII